MRKLEGFRVNGYVPNSGHSGVTIGTGVDLGQQSENGLKLAGISVYILERIKPYLGLRQNRARKYLAEHPLSLSHNDVTELDRAVIERDYIKLEKKYNKESHYKLYNLPGAVQTVIFSVNHQYGNLAKRCPRFWKTAIWLQYEMMINELMHFGDSYPTRRKKEANYLRNFLDNN